MRTGTQERPLISTQAPSSSPPPLFLTCVQASTHIYTHRSVYKLWCVLVFVSFLSPTKQVAWFWKESVTLRARHLEHNGRIKGLSSAITSRTPRDCCEIKGSVKTEIHRSNHGMNSRHDARWKSRGARSFQEGRDKGSLKQKLKRTAHVLISNISVDLRVGTETGHVGSCLHPDPFGTSPFQRDLCMFDLGNTVNDHV